MERKMLHTPEGVRDIYNEECKKKQLLQEKLQRVTESYGYGMIQTPTFEFFDIFGQEIGTTPSKDLYKFFDREGNTLVLRPDITPSVARAAAKYFSGEDMPVRLYYTGNTFINNSSYQGRLKESTQLGAELIGEPYVDADAEMISMAVDCLLAAGLKEFQLSIGHADFFWGLIEAAGLEDEAAQELLELVANKNYFGVEEVISKLSMEEPLRALFEMLGGFYFSADEMAKARELAAEYPRILAAVERLEELHQVLKLYRIEKYVSYELGMVNHYKYYTGIIFAGYTLGSGEPIVKGGRYDRLLGYFGKDAASIGFVIVVDQLMASLARQKIGVGMPDTCECIVYERACLKEAVTRAMRIRKSGGFVELVPRDIARTKEDYELGAARNHRQKITFIEKNGDSEDRSAYE